MKKSFISFVRSQMSGSPFRFIIISIFIPTRLSKHRSFRLLPMLQEVDSKLTWFLLMSITPKHSGIMTLPSSGSNKFVKWSTNNLTNYVSAATPSAGLQPNKNVKLAGFLMDSMAPAPLVAVFCCSSSLTMNFLSIASSNFTAPST